MQADWVEFDPPLGPFLWASLWGRVKSDDVLHAGEHFVNLSKVNSISVNLMSTDCL